MKFFRYRPFLTLAVVTILIGAAWHAAGVGRSDGVVGAVLFGVVSVIGAPFIAATRATHAVVDNRALAGPLALAIGILPYLAADWILRRRRASSTTTA